MHWPRRSRAAAPGAVQSNRPRACARTCAAPFASPCCSINARPPRLTLSVGARRHVSRRLCSGRRQPGCEVHARAPSLRTACAWVRGRSGRNGVRACSACGSAPVGVLRGGPEHQRRTQLARANVRMGHARAASLARGLPAAGGGQLCHANHPLFDEAMACAATAPQSVPSTAVALL